MDGLANHWQVVEAHAACLHSGVDDAWTSFYNAETKAELNNN